MYQEFEVHQLQIFLNPSTTRPAPNQGAPQPPLGHLDPRVLGDRWTVLDRRANAPRGHPGKKKCSVSHKLGWEKHKLMLHISYIYIYLYTWCTYDLRLTHDLQKMVVGMYLSKNVSLICFPSNKIHLYDLFTDIFTYTIPPNTSVKPKNTTSIHWNNATWTMIYRDYCTCLQ